jgi:hypothetical protein
VRLIAATRWPMSGTVRLTAATRWPMSGTVPLIAARRWPIVESDWPTSVNGTPTNAKRSWTTENSDSIYGPVACGNW